MVKYGAIFFMLFSVSRIKLCIQINFINVIIGDNPLYGYPAAAPYFDVAFETMTDVYPDVFSNATRAVFYRPKVNSCRDAGDYIYVVTGQIYDLLRTATGFTVLLTAGCSLELIGLGDFAREVNLPLLASTASDIAFANPLRYPTIVMFGFTGQGAHGGAVRALLRRFNWRTATVLCDALADFPAAAASLAINCRGIKAALSTTAGEFEIFSEDFDSAINPEYEVRLRRARVQSRIIILLVRADELRKVMLTAHLLNMTNEEYVYIHPSISKGPGYVEMEVVMGDAYDSFALDAYQSIITVGSVDPDYAALETFIKSVTSLAKKKYNVSYGYLDQKNELAFGIPEMLFAVGQVLRETSPAGDLTTPDFRRPFLNRTFDTTVRQVRIGSNGVRVSDSVFSKFDSSSRKFKPTWYYDAWNKKMYVNNTMLANTWKGGNSAPPNEPVCGFASNRCNKPSGDPAPGAVCVMDAGFFSFVAHCMVTRCLSSVGNTDVIAGTCGVAVVVAILLAMTLVYMRLSCGQSDSWYLVHDFIRDENDEPAILAPGTACGPFFHAHTMIWCRSMPTDLTEHQIKFNRALQTAVSQIRILRPEWFARFYGIAQSERFIAVVWEYGRGTLRKLYSNAAVMSDDVFRRSIIFNLVHGVTQIHSGSLRYHGSLSSSTIIVDSRFTAKICDVASLQIFRIVSKMTNRPGDGSVVPFETASDQLPLASPEADVYALGIIFGEIMVHIKTLQSDMTRDESSFSEALSRTIVECGLSDKTKRPTVKDVLNTLGPHKPRRTVVDSLIYRLQEHAANLELVVTARTVDLLSERQKADALLSEIIPPMFVAPMRNRLSVPPQFFDRATVMFSSMVGFDKFCLEVDCLQVVAFLNELYAYMDSNLSSHDLYKVETIKDGYVVASGLPVPNGDQHALEVCLLAVRILKTLPMKKKITLAIRIGVHSEFIGPLAAGIVGKRLPRYCLFGDTMNTASRMESHGEASRIHVSSETKGILDGSFPTEFFVEPRGTIQIKGKGLVETFWINDLLPKRFH